MTKRKPCRGATSEPVRNTLARNTLVKRNGRLELMDKHAAQRDRLEIVSPVWSESFAAVMRTIGEQYLEFPRDYAQHVALRKKIESAYERARRKVSLAHLAVAVYLMLQDGKTLAQVLALKDGMFIIAARRLNLVH